MNTAKQIPFNPEQSLETVIAEIKAHLSNEISGIKELVEEVPMNAYESAKFLKIAKNTFYIWAKTGVLPPEVIHHVGSEIRCYPSQLNKFIKSR